jgi:hypothetical protein
MTKKEEKSMQRRKDRLAWKKKHNFREIESCYTCEHHQFNNTDPFGICKLSEIELGEFISIIDSNFICDDWKKPDLNKMVKESLRKQTGLSL